MSRRRQRALQKPFPDQWRRVLERRMGLWALLDDGERARMEDLIRIFVTETTFEAAAGFELTEDMEVIIAALASLMVLELGPDLYREVSSVIVHPSSSLRRGERHVGGGMFSDTPVLLAGEARVHGPVAVSWNDAALAAGHPHTGRNVVFHEFAHKIDMLDGTVDGTPPIPPGPERDRFIRESEHEYLMVRQGLGGHVLDPYAGTNPGEFFAVATEAFFGLPEEMEELKPGLYQAMQGFYRQDPAGRARRA